MAVLHTDEPDLKAKLQATRDAWIAADEADWLAANPSYPAAVAAVAALIARGDPVYVITTKAKPLTLRLLALFQLDVPADRVCGLIARRCSNQNLTVS